VPPPVTRAPTRCRPPRTTTRWWRRTWRAPPPPRAPAALRHRPGRQGPQGREDHRPVVRAADPV